MNPLVCVMAVWSVGRLVGRTESERTGGDLRRAERGQFYRKPLLNIQRWRTAGSWNWSTRGRWSTMCPLT